jgi:hypothetical protein
MLLRNLYNWNYGNISYAWKEIMCCYRHDPIKYNVPAEIRYKGNIGNIYHAIQ